MDALIPLAERIAETLKARRQTVAVVGERIVWWWRFNSRRDPKRLAQVFAALEEGSIEAAQQTCRGSQDPVIRMLDEGLRGYPRAVEENLQVVAMDEVEHAGKYLSVMDTLITLAPLLGLLGTVTGIMGSFQSIGGSALYADAGSSTVALGNGAQVTGGNGILLDVRNAGTSVDLAADGNGSLTGDIDADAGADTGRLFAELAMALGQPRVLQGPARAPGRRHSHDQGEDRGQGATG